MINLHAIKPRLSVNLPVKLTELGQGGAGALGSRDNLSIPCPLWACTGAPSSRDNLSCCSSSTYLGFGPRPKGPHPRGWRGEKEKNGYPFTTFTDFSDFLGILGVLSDDLATMSILLLDHRPISGRNTDFADFY